MAKRARQKKMSARAKAPVQPMSEDRQREVVAQFTDDVLSKLASAFFGVVQEEGWGKRDLSSISGINETAINHILLGRRRNLTIETIALLTRAMRTRPELILHNLRPIGNSPGAVHADHSEIKSAASALEETQVKRVLTGRAGAVVSAATPQKVAGSLRDVGSVLP